jgi:hypothetical protein
MLNPSYFKPCLGHFFLDLIQLIEFNLEMSPQNRFLFRSGWHIGQHPAQKINMIIQVKQYYQNASILTSLG